MGKYKVITLCGSSRFRQEFMDIGKSLTLKGNIVISPELFELPSEGEGLTAEIREMLGDMHKSRIDMADEIFVLNKNGYIGESTKAEIEYAKANKKPVSYMEDPDTGAAQTTGYDPRGEVCRHKNQES